MSDRWQTETLETPRDAAAWDARLRSLDCTTADREDFRRWYEAAAEHRLEYDSLQALLGHLREARDIPEIRSMRESAASRSTDSPMRRVVKWTAGLAAAAGIAASLYVLSSLHTEPASEADYSLSFATEVGERSTATLQDGTVAVLNTNTRLQVTYSEAERRVVLHRGQAIFEVATEKGRPFMVLAGQRLITALGTVFDVRYEDDHVRVILVEGEVEVSAEGPAKPGPDRQASTLDRIRLAAGQQLHAPATSSSVSPIVEAADVERETIWREGRVFFEDAPLSQAVAEMNRYSRTQIIVDASAKDQYRVNGMFRTGQQSNFVMALSQYFPLEAEHPSADRIVLKAKGRDSEFIEK